MKLGHREALASESWRQMYSYLCLSFAINLSLMQMHLDEIEAVWQKQHSALHRPKIPPRNYEFSSKDEACAELSHYATRGLQVLTSFYQWKFVTFLKDHFGLLNEHSTHSQLPIRVFKDMLEWFSEWEPLGFLVKEVETSALEDQAERCGGLSFHCKLAAITFCEYILAQTYLPFLSSILFFRSHSVFLNAVEKL